MQPDEPVGVEGLPTSLAWLSRDFSLLPCSGAPWAVGTSGLEVGACVHRDGEGLWSGGGQRILARSVNLAWAGGLGSYQPRRDIGAEGGCHPGRSVG